MKKKPKSAQRAPMLLAPQQASRMAYLAPPPANPAKAAPGAILALLARFKRPFKPNWPLSKLPALLHFN